MGLAGWRIEPRTPASYLTLSLDQPVGLGSGMVQLTVFGAHEDDRYTFHYVGIYVGKIKIHEFFTGDTTDTLSAKTISD